MKVMMENGGFATLGFLNQNVLKIEDCEWKTKTPFASIRRIVQDERFFFKIRPGLWALKSHRNKLPEELLPTSAQAKAKREEYSHTYYQGLVAELGNFKKYKTFVPNQDKNKLYLGKRLCEVTALPDMLKFGYEHIIAVAKTIDVTWFNERQMPANLFEIEHSTPINNSLLKFVELQDFHANFYIVADNARRTEFQKKLSQAAFSPINKRVGFWSYDDVVNFHSRTSEYIALESRLDL